LRAPFEPKWRQNRQIKDPKKRAVDANTIKAQQTQAYKDAAAHHTRTTALPGLPHRGGRNH
jgi:hypothetical protein